MISTAATVVEEDEDDDDALMMRLTSKDQYGPEVDVWAQFANIGGLTEAASIPMPNHGTELGSTVEAGA